MERKKEEKGLDERTNHLKIGERTNFVLASDLEKSTLAPGKL